jgi:uncharacterized repeat protein (TIGR03803 family)
MRRERCVLAIRLATTFTLVSCNAPAAFAQAPYAVLHSINGNPEAAGPGGALVRARDGTLYGATCYGGPFNHGTLYRVTLGGAFSLVYAFPGGSGGACPGPLLQGADGNFYGTTQIGGGIFRTTPTGQTTILHSLNGTVGASPLVQTPDGALFGVTLDTAFRVTVDGSFALLHTFSGGPTDGQYPNGLVVGSDGALYGTTSYGGTMRGGTMFRMAPDGAVTILVCRRF